MLDRSSHAATPLLEFDWRFEARNGIAARAGRGIRDGGSYVVIVAGIKPSRSPVRVCGAMNRILARFDSDVDDGAGLPAVFRAGILHGLEFVDGVDGQHRSSVARGQDC